MTDLNYLTPETAAMLRKMIASGQRCTIVYSSGIQITGIFESPPIQAAGEFPYLTVKYLASFTYLDQPLQATDFQNHVNGFASPVGAIKSDHVPLEFRMFETRERATLDYQSGVSVTGNIMRVIKEDFKNILIVFDNCTVTDREGAVLHQPGQGNYHLAVGDLIIAVYPVNNFWPEFTQEDCH